MTVDLPSPLTASIKEQRAILFLGAGASLGAVHPAGLAIPDAAQLRDLISDSFLNGKFKDRTLATVTEYAISETSLTQVHTVIADRFRDFGPADFHKIIPTFRWHAIITTNIDLVIERAYEEASGKRLQELVPFVKDGGQVEVELKKYTNGVQYLKLHGCVNHATDDDIPFILSVEQYARWSKHRTRLFARFKDWGHDLPIIFCGYSVNDSHIQSILFDLFDLGIRRPSYFLITPHFDPVEARYWQAHRIVPIKATFQDFLQAVDAAIPSIHRVVPVSVVGGSASIRKHYRVPHPIESAALLAFLENDVQRAARYAYRASGFQTLL